MADYGHFVAAAGIGFRGAAGGGAFFLAARIGYRGSPVIIALLGIEDGDRFQCTLAIMAVQGYPHLGEQDKAGQDI